MVWHSSRRVAVLTRRHMLQGPLRGAASGFAWHQGWSPCTTALPQHGEPRSRLPWSCTPLLLPPGLPLLKLWHSYLLYVSVYAPRCVDQADVQRTDVAVPGSQVGRERHKIIV